MRYILLAIIGLWIMSCQPATEQIETSTAVPVENVQAVAKKDTVKPKPKPKTKGGLGHGYEFENNGKDTEAPAFTSRYQKADWETLPMPAVSSDLSRALKHQRTAASRRKSKTYSLKGMTLSGSKVLNTVTALQQWSENPSEINLEDLVDAYQISGEDNHGNTHFTGYFVPVIKVRSAPDEEYKYPLYQKPSGKAPNRKAIDTDGALKGKGLELAWSANLLDNYFMHVQGSGVVEYENGERVLLSYGGKNNYGYKSVGRYMVDQGHIPAEKISLSSLTEWFEANPERLEEILNINPSYTFFKKVNKEVTGAASVPLTAGHSIAVDKRIIPLGSCLLGKVPVLDDNGYLIGHEYKILVAQDVGGAIKGGHVDLYSGEGERGKQLADAMHHYGKLWLLVAK